MWTMGRLDHRIDLKQVFKGLNQVTFHYFCHILWQILNHIHIQGFRQHNIKLITMFYYNYN